MSLRSNRLLFVFVALAASLAGHAWLLKNAKEKIPSAQILERWGHQLRDQDDYKGAAAAYRLAIRRGEKAKRGADLEAHLGLALLQAGEEAAAYEHLLRAKKGGAAESLYDLTLRAMAYDVDESGPFPRFAASHSSSKQKEEATNSSLFPKQIFREGGAGLLAKNGSPGPERASKRMLPVEEEAPEKDTTTNEEPNPASANQKEGVSTQSEARAENDEDDDEDDQDDDDLNDDHEEGEEPVEVHEGDCEVPVSRRGTRGTFLAEVSINGTTATLIVDTGASLTVVGREFAEEVGLEILPDKKLSAQTAAGKVRFDLARIEEVEIGGRVLHDVMVAICDECATEQMDGLLGLDVQIPLHLALDVANEKLRFGDCEPAN